ncbi:T-cell receptor-associated transmembrane adapter 1 [Plecturocebus cupreus]
MISEPTDENCYEQMKARPEKSVNEMQETTPYSQATNETQMCYASLDHSIKGMRRKPRKQNIHLSDKNGDEQSHATDASVSKTTLVDSFSPESQAVEENIHDDPIRLFGLIRAKREPIN